MASGDLISQGTPPPRLRVIHLTVPPASAASFLARSGGRDGGEAEDWASKATSLFPDIACRGLPAQVLWLQIILLLLIQDPGPESLQPRLSQE